MKKIENGEVVAEHGGLSREQAVGAIYAAMGGGVLDLAEPSEPTVIEAKPAERELALAAVA